MNPNQSPSPSTAPAASGASPSTLFYQKLSQVYETVRVLLDEVRSLQTMVEITCPHLRSHRSNLDAMHAAQQENLEQRLRQADITPEPRPPPKRLKLYTYIRKVVIGMESNDITGGYIDGKQLAACSDDLKRRMPEGIMHCDLRHLGGDESDYFTSDAQAERAAPMIRERTDWRLDPKRQRDVDHFKRN